MVASCNVLTRQSINHSTPSASDSETSAVCMEESMARKDVHYCIDPTFWRSAAGRPGTDGNGALLRALSFDLLCDYVTRCHVLLSWHCYRGVSSAQSVYDHLQLLLTSTI